MKKVKQGHLEKARKAWDEDGWVRGRMKDKYDEQISNFVVEGFTEKQKSFEYMVNLIKGEPNDDVISRIIDKFVGVNIKTNIDAVSDCFIYRGLYIKRCSLFPIKAANGRVYDGLVTGDVILISNELADALEQANKGATCENIKASMLIISQ